MNAPILSSTDRSGALYRNKSLPAHMMGGAPPRRDNIPGKHAVPSSPRNNRPTFSIMLNELETLELKMELERQHETPALPPAYVPMTRTSSQNHARVVQSSSVLGSEYFEFGPVALWRFLHSDHADPENDIDGVILLSLSEHDMQAELGINDALFHRNVVSLVQQLHAH
ncbi:hypothetical protein BC830DRAFT_1220864 [Chytriomyces sp. MP71]|nr:hypothetical protein BC830DRAFT_1220864 [Chytriomyces sp. MP71]